MKARFMILAKLGCFNFFLRGKNGENKVLRRKKWRKQSFYQKKKYIWYSATILYFTNICFPNKTIAVRIFVSRAYAFCKNMQLYALR